MPSTCDIDGPMHGSLPRETRPQDPHLSTREAGRARQGEASAIRSRAGAAPRGRRPQTAPLATHARDAASVPEEPNLKLERTEALELLAVVQATLNAIVRSHELTVGAAILTGIKGMLIDALEA